VIIGAEHGCAYCIKKGQMMKIAIVGNAHFKGDYGEQIDVCDIVFRFNKAIVKGYEKKVGSKTTHLGVANESPLNINKAVSEIQKDILQRIDHIWIPHYNYNMEFEKKLKRKAGKLMHFKYCHKQLYELLYIMFDCKKYENYSCFPSTGIIIIIMAIMEYGILKDRTRALSIIGFDGFKTGHYYGDLERADEVRYHPTAEERAFLQKLGSEKNITIH
jgi:hypothetical protein